MARDFDVRVDGLKEFRRDLKRVEPEAAKALQKELRAAVGKVAIEAAATAPRKSGTLARSFRPFTRGNTAGVYSDVPYAPVLEYGGTIEPKGTPIKIRRYETVTKAVIRQQEAIVDHIGDAMDDAARRAGWH